MRRFAVVIEKSKTGFSAYVPDLPGCVATGRTLATAQAGIRAAIALHLQGMRADGLAAPVPAARCEYVEA